MRPSNGICVRRAAAAGMSRVALVADQRLVKRSFDLVSQVCKERVVAFAGSPDKEEA